MVKFLFAACFGLLSAPVVANRLPANKIGGCISRNDAWSAAGLQPTCIARLITPPTIGLYTASLTLTDSARKPKASVVTIRAFAEKISQPLYTAVVVIQSRATGKSERFTLPGGKLERTFTTPDELLIEVMADGYESVKHTMTIAVSPQGNRYEFDAELDPLPIKLIVMAVDSRTKKMIRDAYFTISDKFNRKTFRLTPDSTTGLAATDLPGRGIYQLTSSATGYSNFTRSIKLDSIQSEARVMLTPETLPDASKPQALPEAVVKSTGFPSVDTVSVKKELIRSGSIRVPAVTNAPLALPETGKFTQLSAIHFDQSSPVLRPESNAELNQLYDMLVKNPATRIEIRGHTDNQGDFDANVQLSRDRCQAVIDYLVARGIRKDRLTGVGRGPIDPVAPNNNEGNRKKNRRVEFTTL